MRFDTEASPRLSAAIETLYSVFANYPAIGHDEGSSLKDPIDPAVLHADLRSIPDEVVGLIARRAITTLGDDVLLRHFIPRILEVLAQGDAGLDEEWALSRLRLAEWWRWPPVEHEAIGAFFVAWADGWLGRSDVWTVKDLLNGVAASGFDLMPLIERVRIRLETDWSVREWLSSTDFDEGRDAGVADRSLAALARRPEVQEILADHLAEQNWRIVELRCPDGHGYWAITCDGPSWEQAPGPIEARVHECRVCGTRRPGHHVLDISPPLFFQRTHPATTMARPELQWWVTVLCAEFEDSELAREWLAEGRNVIGDDEWPD